MVTQIRPSTTELERAVWDALAICFTGGQRVPV